MTSSVLASLQTRFGPELERTLREHLAGAPPTETFYGMMRYQMGYVDEALRPSASSGGKRFRPLLCLFTCDLLGGNWREALPVAAAIELLHNFSLIHDDIEDRDPMRRHRATVWKVWGEAQAINVGDGMFALAYRALLDAHPDPEVCLDLLRHFDKTVRQLTEGQYLDMRYEEGPRVSPEEYLHMIYGKTAVLPGFSLYAGARLAGASAEICAALAVFGRELGLAFQIRDDMHGIWGNPEETGKEAHSDLRNRKQTLPVLLAGVQLRDAQAEMLQRFFGRKTHDVAAVLAVLNGTDCRRAAEDEARLHLNAAGRALHAACLPATAAAQFMALAHELTG